MFQDQTAQRLVNLENENNALRLRIQALETILVNSRVVIKNFEGALKIGSSVPTTNDTQEGSIMLTNESGTYKLYARINNGWRAVTLT